MRATFKSKSDRVVSYKIVEPQVTHSQRLKKIKLKSYFTCSLSSLLGFCGGFGAVTDLFVAVFFDFFGYAPRIKFATVSVSSLRKGSDCAQSRLDWKVVVRLIFHFINLQSSSPSPPPPPPSLLLVLVLVLLLGARGGGAWGGGV